MKSDKLNNSECSEEIDEKALGDLQKKKHFLTLTHKMFRWRKYSEF